MSDYPELCINCGIGKLHFIGKTVIAKTADKEEHSASLFNCLFCDSLLKLEIGLLSIERQGKLYQKIKGVIEIKK